MSLWIVTNKFDSDCAALADRHYSRRTVGSPQFMPPGETLILKRKGAVWGWWRPHPRSGIKARNGLDGWTCSIFRNESDQQSSGLILDAEIHLATSNRGCGPDGMLTYVWDKRVTSKNPGYCYKLCGWQTIGRSADNKKTLLWKPIDCAGFVPPQLR